MVTQHSTLCSISRQERNSPFYPTWETPQLPHSGVHIWRARLPDCDEVRDPERALSAQERAHADRFLNTRARKQFVAGRLILRDILSQYTRQRPDEVRISIDAHGKPYLAERFSHIKFSASRSGDLALFCVAEGQQLGIDLEAIDSELCDDGVAALTFTVSELDCWSRLSGQERIGAFFCCWTRKEAVSKWMGMGLGADLKNIEVGLTPRVTFDGQLTLWSLIPSSGYIAAMACAHRAPLTCYWDWHLRNA